MKTPRQAMKNNVMWLGAFQKKIDTQKHTQTIANKRAQSGLGVSFSSSVGQ